MRARFKICSVIKILQSDTSASMAKWRSASKLMLAVCDKESGVVLTETTVHVPVGCKKGRHGVATLRNVSWFTK